MSVYRFPTSRYLVSVYIQVLVRWTDDDDDDDLYYRSKLIGRFHPFTGHEGP